MSTKTRVNYRQIGGPDGLLANRRSFSGNTMWADYTDSSLDTLSHCGKLYLHSEIQEQMREQHSQGFRATYVVWSYNTPIAYVLNDGRVFVPDVKYSVTTSRQQGLCRAWLPCERKFD